MPVRRSTSEGESSALIIRKISLRPRHREHPTGTQASPAEVFDHTPFFRLRPSSVPWNTETPSTEYLPDSPYPWCFTETDRWVPGGIRPPAPRTDADLPVIRISGKTIPSSAPRITLFSRISELTTVSVFLPTVISLAWSIYRAFVLPHPDRVLHISPRSGSTPTSF